MAEYVNVTTLDAVAPYPPQVALTVNVPLVHAWFPPGCEVKLKLPSAMLGMTSVTSATVPAEFSIVIMTAVFGPRSRVDGASDHDRLEAGVRRRVGLKGHRVARSVHRRGGLRQDEHERQKARNAESPAGRGQIVF